MLYKLYIIYIYMCVYLYIYHDDLFCENVLSLVEVRAETDREKQRET